MTAEGEKAFVVIEGTMRDNNTSCVLKVNGKTIKLLHKTKKQDITFLS